MKKLLIPNGSFHDIPLIKTAKELGYYVITSGAAPDGKGHGYADEYVYGDFSDVELMLKIAKEKKIDAVCSNCNDFGYLSACYIAEKMGLGGHESYENALILHHKDKFKKFAKANKMYSPIADDFCDAFSAYEYAETADYPIIIKPTDLGAGQGIHRADSITEAKKYIDEAFAKSKAKNIVIEPFIEGTAHSFNAFVVNKKVVGYYSDNEYMKYSTYRVSTSAGPADFIDEVKDILIEQTELVADKLELTDGLVHSQYILDKEHVPHILEITRRMSGDWYPYPEIRATGVNWMEYIVKAQCKMDCSDFPKDMVQKGFTGRHCLNSKKTGIVKDVKLKPEFKKYVFDRAMWLEDGFEIKNIEKDYPGILFFDFETREQMMEIVRNIDEYIELMYE